ncbi:clathrin adaptor complex small chain [Colletotrichum falcatum]|nr:clathrin adaptor complex small chain [Colletotrichum falcatum]
MAPGMSLFSVNAILILSIEDGSRLFSKYYSAPHHGGSATQNGSSDSPGNPYPDVKSQKAFEKGLLEKTAKQTGDIILYDNRIVLYKMESDVMMYVVGGVDENEVLLYNVILALRDSLHLLFKQSVDKRTIVENYDLVSLAIDEIVDDGIILETDPTIIVQRVSKAPAQDVDLRRIDLSEQGVNNLAQLGKSKLADWLRQGL